MFDETPPSTKSQASNTCQSCELLALLAGNLNLQLTIQSHKTSRFCSPQKIFPPRQLDARRSWLVPLALGQVPLPTETGERLLPRHVIRRRSWLIVPLLTEGTGVLPRHAIRRRSWLIEPLLTEGAGDAARRQSWLVPLTLGQVPLLTEGTGVIPRQANCAVLKFGAVSKFVFAALDLNHCSKTLTFVCLQPRSSVEVPLYTVSGSTQQLLARLGATPPTHPAAQPLGRSVAVLASRSATQSHCVTHVAPCSTPCAAHSVFNSTLGFPGEGPACAVPSTDEIDMMRSAKPRNLFVSTTDMAEAN